MITEKDQFLNHSLNTNQQQHFTMTIVTPVLTSMNLAVWMTMTPDLSGMAVSVCASIQVGKRLIPVVVRLTSGDAFSCVHPPLHCSEVCIFHIATEQSTQTHLTQTGVSPSTWTFTQAHEAQKARRCETSRVKLFWDNMKHQLLTSQQLKYLLSLKQGKKQN